MHVCSFPTNTQKQFSGESPVCPVAMGYPNILTNGPIAIGPVAIGLPYILKINFILYLSPYMKINCKWS